VAKRQPIIGIILDQGFGNPVIGATLLQEYFAVLADLLGGDQRPAGFAQAGGLAIE
jgi:hypothetical protein